MAVSLPLATAGAQTTETEAPAKAAKEKKICKTAEGETYSRVRKKVCRTAAEWENSRSKVDAGDLRRMGAN